MASATTFHVKKDTREQLGWIFPKGGTCSGMSVATLKTGDYTIDGLEDQFVIERKGSTAEWAKNICEKRFERELERLDCYIFPFIILEFSYTDLLIYPRNSGIPKSKWNRIRVTPEFLLKRTLEIQCNHKVKIIAAGEGNGFRVAWQICKEMSRRVAQQ